MATPVRLPAAVDPNRPSVARIYDALLGGHHNFAADRAVATRAVEFLPEIPGIIAAERAFLLRAVRYAAERGIRQFLELGSGLPAGESVHEAARRGRTGARVAYVDWDPTAILHAREILREDPDVVAVPGDIQRPETFLADPELRSVLDFSEPVCILLVGVLPFLPDSPELTVAMRRFHDISAPGSLLVLSHVTASARARQFDRLVDLLSRTGTPLAPRDDDQVNALFEGWNPIEPGIVPAARWHPDPGTPAGADPASWLTVAGVAVRRQGPLGL
ncbi:SAM-dependent methyltransferase [Actinoplanes sp. NPDC026623]|uniref:SAM-dependent methyltransferase n=1 Tax=Actinoplanes sp. NPDC026623 TaxID=3155610 RepID=UPI00341048A1